MLLKEPFVMINKPIIDLDNCNLDDVRIEIAGDQSLVPESWYTKTMSEKKKWILKRFRRETRHVHADVHDSKRDQVKTRIQVHNIKKEREKQADVLKQLGLAPI